MIIPPHTLIKDGLTVSAVLTEAKTVTPSASQKTYAPSAGKYFSGFTVNGDADLKAENVRKGTNIFGTIGTLVEGISAADFGFTKLTYGSFTPTSHSTDIKISHNLGTPIKVLLILSSYTDSNNSNIWMMDQCVIDCGKRSIGGTCGTTLSNATGFAGFVGVVSGSTFNDNNVFNATLSNQYMPNKTYGEPVYFKSGKKYYWIALA